MAPFQTLPDGTLVGPGFSLHPRDVMAVLPYHDGANVFVYFDAPHPPAMMPVLLGQRVVDAVTMYRQTTLTDYYRPSEYARVEQPHEDGVAVGEAPEAWPGPGADPFVGVVPSAPGTMPDFGNANVNPNSPDLDGVD